MVPNQKILVPGLKNFGTIQTTASKTVKIVYKTTKSAYIFPPIGFLMVNLFYKTTNKRQLKAVNAK